jgi:uroporphyrinogen decarboxylase
MELMTSRERILAAINLQPVDRIPTDIWATTEIINKLTEIFGSLEAVYQKLHIDGIPGVNARYIGPSFPDFPEEIDETASVFYGIWGMRLKRQVYPDGIYLEQANYPLASAKTITDLEAYSWPSADWFDYSDMSAQAEVLRQTHGVACGYMAPFYLHNLLRGLETSLVDPLEDAEFTHHLLRKICDFEYEYHRRMFEACDGLIDVAQVTDDLGSQTGPIMGIKTYHEFYAPHHKRFIDLCHEFGIKVFHHDDGSMRKFLPDLVSMGINILNPVQWVCPNMDMVELKKEYGESLCFHGAIENQKILPFGTPEEVRAEVRHCIDALASDGTGYILASCHNIQPITPVENIIAMYDEAYHYGRFI